MSLYHEAAAILSQDTSEGGSLKSRVFGRKDLKSPPTQLYALVSETCKWSAVLKEVIEATGILEKERKLTPVLSILLSHDFLLSKSGISLPQSHGLRASIERHKARLASEFTRARLRRKFSSVDALRARVEADFSAKSGPPHPRWVRVNTLRTTVRDQLRTTFAGFETVSSVRAILDGAEKAVCVDDNVPGLLALSPDTDFTKTEAYRSGAIILQDKASCFPAYLLDPTSLGGGDVIDSCAAPGNKTTQLAALLHLGENDGTDSRRIFAFEKDKNRAKTLERMVTIAGADQCVQVGKGQDFLQVDPEADIYKDVRALLLDPSCSGSGIVGRDEMPELHLPERHDPQSQAGKENSRNKKSGGTKSGKAALTSSSSSPSAMPASSSSSKPGAAKRKRTAEGETDLEPVLLGDDGQPIPVGSASSTRDIHARIDALAAFQLSLLLHAFRFPSARRITYSTCSVYARENEEVVLEALQSDIARARGWRILRREEQVRGMRGWPVRGSAQASQNYGTGDNDGMKKKKKNKNKEEEAEGTQSVAEACVRAYRDDGRGTMGFFVAAFIRDEGASARPCI